MNPAIDRNVDADRLVFEDRAYILATRETAGGRGINCSCVIHSFGGPTRAIIAAGGEHGHRLASYLQCCGYGVDIVPIANDVRVNLTITDRQGLTVKLNERGPAVSAEEVALIEARVVSQLSDVRWLLLCGSLPPGVPRDFYARLVRLAEERKVPVMLDTDGEALIDGTEAGPALVIPNQQEAERLLNRALLTRTQFIEAALRIRQMGARSVVISLGSRGAVGTDGRGVYEAVPPRIDAVCPIGAGDALAAAVVWALDKGAPFEEAMRWGVATGTATARLPGTAFASLDQARAMLPEVTIERAAA